MHPKLAHLARTVDYAHIKDTCEELACAIESEVLTMMGADYDIAPAQCLVQMALPLRRGDLGISSLTRHRADAALVAGAAVAQAALAGASEHLHPLNPTRWMRSALQKLWMRSALQKLSVALVSLCRCL